MDRRNFLSLAALALAGQAAQRVWPFRVYSIPKEIVAPSQWDQPLMTLPSSFEIPSRFVKAMKLHVYSPDFKVNRGSFLATMYGGSVLGDIPTGIQPGDILVSETHGPLMPVADIVAHAYLPYLGLSDRRTGVFLNLTRS